MPASFLVPDAAAAAWVSLLAAAAAKGVALLALAAIAAWALRRGAAAVRHAFWTGAVLGLLLMPVAPRLAPVPALRILPSWLAAPVAGTPPVSPAPAPRSAAAGAREAATPASIPASEAVGGETGGGNGRMGWVFLAWALGAAMVLARLLAGTLRLQRIARGARRVTDAGWLRLAQEVSDELGVARPIRLAIGSRLPVAVTWGVVYPLVLLPADALEWNEGRRRMVLLHEAAHVRRFDRATQLLGQLALSVFWFLPPLWLAVRQMDRECEAACDDHVLRRGVMASAYAGELLAIARTLHARRLSALAPLSFAARCTLERRVASILSPAPRRRAPRWAAALAAVCMLAAGAQLAAVRAQPAGDRARAPAAAGARWSAEVWSGSIPAGAWLRLRNYRGDVSVRTVFGSVARVTAQAHAPGGAEIPVRFSVLRDGESVTLCATWPRTTRCEAETYVVDQEQAMLSRHGNVRVDLVVTVPRGVRVLAGVHQGDLRISGVEGEVDASTGNGAIDVERVRGAVEARSGNGGIRVASLSGPVQAATGNGDLRIEMAEPVREGEMEYATSNGTVHLVLPRAFAGTLALRQGAGALRSAFPLAPAAPAGAGADEHEAVSRIGNGGGPLLRVAATHGDVILERSP
ncbi:MAG TPA: M56 family metallopeptidase [Longimicrobium sp.]|nr:M56 family metallopeptidase [Longimicrobium sp.]